MTLDNFAFWVSTPNLDFLEMAAKAGFRRAVLDVEHNAFSPDRREAFVVAARALGVSVAIKIEGPEPIYIQRALDLGVDAVIIPHIANLKEAEAALATSKFPPLGTRSYAAGRSASFAPPADTYFSDCNTRVLCLPMIETSEAFEDLEAILASPLVDGVFVGPFDLALTRGRPNYRFGDDDRADIARIAQAAAAAGKPWWVPAWRPAEQEFSEAHGAAVRVIAAEHQVIQTGLNAIIEAIPHA